MKKNSSFLWIMSKQHTRLFLMSLQKNNHNNKFLLCNNNHNNIFFFLFLCFVFFPMEGSRERGSRWRKRIDEHKRRIQENEEKKKKQILLKYH